MKKFLLLGIVAATAFASCNTGSKTPKSEMDTLAYSIGVDLGTHVKSLDSTLNVDMIASAMKDVLKNNGKMTLEEAHNFLNEYFSIRKPMQELKKSEDFLAETEKKTNVQKTESGLLYEIIEEGTIKANNNADTVVVAYVGTLPNGTVFDSTEKQGQESISFPLDRVIPAWTEGMKLIGKGGKVKLYVHPDLAYGARGQGPVIGPNQALVFEVELKDVKFAQADEQAELE